MFFPELIGESRPLRAVRAQIARLLDRPPDAMRLPPVLLVGETGTGKSVLARAIHRGGPRRHGPFVEVNCAALPETLLEAEMFGFERGAFTDARQAKAGLFETADGGILFLDEIGFLPDSIQTKLLKAIEERTVRRLGATRSRSVDVWIFGATSDPLDTAMRQGHFRPALYHRLAVFTVRLPPLRERGDDILLLADHFLRRACGDYQLPPKAFAEDARAVLRAHHWPGNVRELSNVIERSALLADAALVSARDLAMSDEGEVPLPAPSTASQPTALGTIGRDQLLAALEEGKGSLAAAAARLGIPRNTLRYRLERLGLRVPPPSRQRGARRGAEPRSAEVRAPAGADEGPGAERPSLEAPPIRAGGRRWQRRRVAFLRVNLVVPPGTHPETDTSRALQVVAEKLDCFGGRVEEAGLTHVVAAFGLTPVEDAPRRAALAAIAITTASQRASVRATAPRATLKVAIDVADCRVAHIGGGAVIDADSRNRACTALEILTGMAEPHDIAASEAAATFLERRFELLPTPHRHPGPEGCFLLRGPERPGFGARGEAMAFLGREQELSLLASRLGSSRSGAGHVVAIVGEAGMGKSRLVFEFRRRAGGPEIAHLEGRCYSHATAIPYSPVLDVMRQLVGLTDADDEEAVRTKVLLTLEQLGLAVGEVGRYLLPLLEADGQREGPEGRGFDGEPPLRGDLEREGPEVSPELRKARIFDAIRQMIVSASRRQPCVVLLEDLHWIDTASDELVALLVETVPAAPILLVVTYRPEYQPSWRARSHVTQVGLPALSRGDSRAVLDGALAGAAVAPEVIELIVHKAEGNPFFLEELGRAVGESPRGGGTGTVPDTIQDVLMARIDRLPAADRRVLQVAAIIGKDAPLAVMEKMIDDGPGALRQSLRALQAGEFLHETRSAPAPEYTFKHALTQEVAYGSLSDDERRPLHARAARALVQLSPEVAERRPESVARHLTAAQLAEEAIPLWLRAGRNARRRSAGAEAVNHLATALDLLMTLPENRERDEQELELQVALGPALVMSKGYAAAEVEIVYRRARVLCQRLGDGPQIFRASVGAGLFFLFRGDLRAAQEAAEQLLEMATRAATPFLLARAHAAMGIALFYRGQLRAARSHLDESIRLGWPAGQAAPAGSDRQEISVESLAFLGWALGLQGREGESIRCVAAALRRAEQNGNPFALASALNFATFHHQFRRDFQAGGDCADRLIAIATEHRFPHLLGWGIWGKGRALAAQGRSEEGLRLMTEGVTMLRASGGLGGTYYFAHIAETHLIDGRLEQGLAALDQAFAAAERNDERFYLAELHRLRGELLGPDPARSSEAEKSFAEAVDVARRQDSPVLGRRAAHAFALYLRERGRLAEAEQMERELYSTFADPPAS